MYTVNLLCLPNITTQITYSYYSLLGTNIRYKYNNNIYSNIENIVSVHLTMETMTKTML